MNLLIDTHVALWIFNDHSKLSNTAKEHLLDESNNLHISIIKRLNFDSSRVTIL